MRENIRPEKFVLRCYAYRSKNGPYIAVCIDLNIAAQADSFDELKIKMNDMIRSYLESVIDTNDRDSVPLLLSRKAPLRDHIIYCLIKFAIFIRQFPKQFIFDEYIPFSLAHN